MKRTGIALALAVLINSAASGGVCLLKARGGPDDGRPFVVSLDVCGHGSPASVSHAFESASVDCMPETFYFPVISVVPPSPAKAAATADPGESERPPEA